ncbi:GTP cyclohydrolase II [Candidatus Kaiserbacteria bacterium]|nr:GTP cyclohydrolase II [Candidatus Kaiserbacteria bacterium]
MAIKSTMQLETSFGVFQTSYHDINGKMIVSFACNDVMSQIPLVRMHSGCIFGDVFHSLHCDCGQQKDAAMRAIKRHGRGVFLYSPFQEGRGHGLEVKIREMAIQREKGLDTIEAFRSIGLEPDIRTYEREVAVLKELGVPRAIIHFSGNPHKRAALEAEGFVVEQIEWCEPLGELAAAERGLKKSRLNYAYRDEQ